MQELEEEDDAFVAEYVEEDLEDLFNDGSWQDAVRAVEDGDDDDEDEDDEEASDAEDTAAGSKGRKPKKSGWHAFALACPTPLLSLRSRQAIEQRPRQQRLCR